MRIITTILFFALLASASLTAQNSIEQALTEIERNNTTLQALRQTTLSQQLENKMAVYPENPQVDVNRLWGSPGNTGNRIDLSVSQSLDLGFLTGAKVRFANAQNKVLDRRYETERLNILLEAKQYFIELTYNNALRKELAVRLEHALSLADAYQQRLDKGDASILEYNKVQLALSMVEGEISRVDVERSALLSQLKRLNGGSDVQFAGDSFAPSLLPPDFDSWYSLAEQRSPLLAAARQEVEAGKRQVALSHTMVLPAFSIGFMNERTLGQQYRGVVVGLSVPLWSAAPKIRQAKATVLAAEMRTVDIARQLRGRLEIAFNRALGLKKTGERYRASLRSLNNTGLLKKALDTGEISLLNYIVEIGLYYTTVNQTLEAERDFQKALAELTAVEL